MAKNLAEIAPAVGRKPMHVLYDRATSKFKKSTLAEKKELFDKIDLDGQTEGEGRSIALKKGRPVMLLSSTSYTPDEDFMQLVKALDITDKESEVPPI